MRRDRDFMLKPRFSYWAIRWHGIESSCWSQDQLLGDKMTRVRDFMRTEFSSILYVCQDSVEPVPCGNRKYFSAHAVTDEVCLVVPSRGCHRTRLPLWLCWTTLPGGWRSICGCHCSLTGSIIKVIYCRVPQCSAVIAGYIHVMLCGVCVSFVTKR
jgi:hypothetical protein